MNRLDHAVARFADFLIDRRKLLGIVFGLVTLFFAASATRVQLDPGFLKLIPVEHPYMKTMMEYMKDFSGANTMLVNLRWKGEGDIYNPDFMKALQKANDDVFFIPGVNRTKVSSLYSPSTYYIEITEEGFDGKPVVPARFSGLPEELNEVRKNVSLSGQIGLLVSNDLKGALIRADLLDYNPDAPPEKQKVDYWQVQQKLEDIRGRFESQQKYIYKLKHDQPPLKAGQVVAEGYAPLGWMRWFHKFEVPLQDSSVTVEGSDVTVEVVKNPDYDPRIEVNIIGFARLLGDVIKGLLGVFSFFGLAFAITVVLLFLYTRSLRLTISALVVALLPVIWMLGVLPMIGYGVDPMSILTPFLIFAIGVSHAVQMSSAWRLEVLAGHNSVEASRESFKKMFIPGAAGLLTEVLGFGIIMMIDIPIVHELGIAAMIGVAWMIITNKMILPILLSYMQLEKASREHSLREHSVILKKVFSTVSRVAEPRIALGVFAISMALLVWATIQSRWMVIGDSGTGVPELHEDSRYNVDSRAIADTYNIGVDVLTVITEAKNFEGDSCLHYEVVDLIDRFESFVRGIDGVHSVVGVGGVGKLVIAAFNEGNPRWRALPRSEVGLSTGSKAFDPNLVGLNTDGCKAIQTLIFMESHDGNVIEHTIGEIERFIEANKVEGVNMRLATGNVGVMAATNEAVEDAEIGMLVAIFGSMMLFCYGTFRSWVGTLGVMIPLMMVSVFCNGLMALLGIGLKVSTLPVVSLGVGVGVDYGLYLFERAQSVMEEQDIDFQHAFETALWERGSACMFTAITMSIGVATWTMSALKYQADMGLLLAFMFLVNMLGAICVLPALCTWFYRSEHLGGGRAPAAAKA